MDTSWKDKEPPETKESAVNNSENASFILGTGKLVTPQKLGPEGTPNLCTPNVFKTPLNFSTVTVEQLGITPESFLNNSSGKSSSYHKKFRRRSAVGSRGSPETNHLIRFIAQQRNLKSAERSPFGRSCGSPFQGSPGLYRNVNFLRERISAFQSAFHPIMENEKMADCSEFSEAEGGSKTTGLTKNEGLGEYQQSGFPANLQSKRRRISRSSSEDALSNMGAEVMDLQVFTTDADRTCAAGASTHLPEKSSELDCTQSDCAVEESVSLPEIREPLSGIEAADCVEGTGSVEDIPLDILTAEVSSDTNTVPNKRSPVTPVCRKNILLPETVVLRSVLKKPSAKLFPERSQEHHDNLCDDGTQPSLISALSNCCKEQKAEPVEDQESCKALALQNVRKRKRVTFGEDLSPEVFDESLPANTPLRKGGTPVRQRDLSSVSPLLLEQSPVPEQLLQPNFDDKGENLENIEPLDVSFAVLSPNKASMSETLSGIDTLSSSNNHEKISSCKVGRVTRTSNRRKQSVGFTEENVCNLHNTESKPCKEKKINKRKSQETKCTNRALPKKNQVLKTSRKKGNGKKRVQKPLYGEREIASKKPLLSPIPELPEVYEMIPSGPSIGRTCSDSSALAGSATCGEEPSTNAKDTEDRKNIPETENKLESEKEPKTKTDNSQIPCASGTKEHIMSHNPKPDFIPQCQEFSLADQNVEKDINIKCERKDKVLATEEKLPDSQEEFNHLEDVLSGNIKEFVDHSEALLRKSAESSSVRGCRERKHRRRSVYYSDDQNLNLEQNKDDKPSCSLGSAVEISLEASELCKDLSDVIEQTFQRSDSETKVRRSTRLQRDSESKGLMWVSLPFPSTAPKAKRRTISTSDSRGFGHLTSRQDSGALPSISGEESLAADPCPPGRRRKSFCGSTLASTHSTTQPTGYRRRAFLQEKGESSPLPSGGLDPGES
ncbi:cell division cycle-associated protein 2 isoform X3 [Castor canadensis]|uniref:Cell division cycle-associated protein 2 isoform X3 n=1 Tax=Castor canadensis TaxID=51338 RepID=A0AC58L2B5_CASCN